MKVIVWNKPELLHIELPNGIINIRCKLTDRKDRAVDSIEILPNRFAGEPKVKSIPGKYNHRLVELKTVKV